MYELRMKRIYEDIAPDDGQRVLVDRLWPRGVKKDQAALAAWPKEITPSAELRKLYHAGELPFEGFAATYLDELEASAPAQRCEKHGTEPRPRPAPLAAARDGRALALRRPRVGAPLASGASQGQLRESFTRRRACSSPGECGFLWSARIGQDGIHTGLEIALDVGLPESEHEPALFGQGVGHFAVALDIAG